MACRVHINTNGYYVCKPFSKESDVQGKCITDRRCFMVCSDLYEDGMSTPGDSAEGEMLCMSTVWLYSSSYGMGFLDPEELWLL
jgi:hypothetical protein